MTWEWPWTAPRKATAPAPAPGLPPGMFVDYGPAVHALELHHQRLDADVRGLKTEWLDHAVRMEGLIRKMLRLPATNGNDDETTPAVTVSGAVVTRADLLRQYRLKGGRA